ncbi:hypothetical protein [Lactobacillus xylocopicola]|uniref:Uncharacterized protein n=1 Tax=Lactobacillus xylocopicola TaxID=2976676 RepID=A0ABN6SIG3_9LACO|nr:hypothetical protein [Lactobacillus xylocopicola]BDR60105.1 hypothetical protein KIM322_03660 [Lactobacillus xylocopicola]
MGKRKKTYVDDQTNFVFSPESVCQASYQEVQEALVRYRLAVKKNKQTDIWLRLCQTLEQEFGGSVLTFIESFDNDVVKIRHYMQVEVKGYFSYLSEKKLCNYWLFLLNQYVKVKLKNVSKIEIAADTHIIKASKKLGLINKEQLTSSQVQDIVIKAWSDLLKNVGDNPIDFQTPVWLWARDGFPTIVAEG